MWRCVSAALTGEGPSPAPQTSPGYPPVRRSQFKALPVGLCHPVSSTWGHPYPFSVQVTSHSLQLQLQEPGPLRLPSFPTPVLLDLGLGGRALRPHSENIVSTVPREVFTRVFIRCGILCKVGYLADEKEATEWVGGWLSAVASLCYHTCDHRVTVWSHQGLTCGWGTACRGWLLLTCSLLPPPSAQPVSASAAHILGEVCRDKQEAAIPLVRLLLHYGRVVPFISAIASAEVKRTQ